MIPYDSRFKKQKKIGEPKNLPCSFCSKIIPTLGELLEHEEQHEKEFDAQSKTSSKVPYSQSNEEYNEVIKEEKNQIKEDLEALKSIKFKGK